MALLVSLGLLFTKLVPLTFILGVVFIQAIHQQILSNKFLIVRMRELLWRKEDCQKFYQEHEGRINSPLSGRRLYPKRDFSWTPNIQALSDLPTIKFQPVLSLGLYTNFS